jgi:hypothetical protein
VVVLRAEWIPNEASGLPDRRAIYGVPRPPNPRLATPLRKSGKTVTDLALLWLPGFLLGAAAAALLEASSWCLPKTQARRRAREHATLTSYVSPRRRFRHLIQRQV